jgi:hypothetical protein
MQSVTELNGHSSPIGIERLESALRKILGENFEIELRAMVESSDWYRQDLPCSEAFRLWICDNLEHWNDPQWIFQPMRVNERKFLCDELGIPRGEILGKSPRQLAGIIMLASGLPCQDIAGLQTLRGAWEETHRLVDHEEDERAAVLCRQRGERLLRELLLFYCGVGYAEYFVQVIRDPGNLRMPSKLVGKITGTTPGERSAQLIDTLMDDSFADLGFLVLALRKFSMRVEEGGEKHICGEILRIFSQREHDAFSALSTALQAYHHDKPSRWNSRRGDLLLAIESIQTAVEAMAARRVVPDELFVTESSCATPFGRAFRGLVDTGKIRCLTAENSPRLGGCIRFITSADRDYARCMWWVSRWESRQG